MIKDTNSFYILQVSDFHLSEESKEVAKDALVTLKDKLNEMDIRISYLIHTGDVINSRDISLKIEQEHGSSISDEEYDTYLEKIVTERFKIAKEIMDEFIKSIDVLRNNIIVCCGNHDKVRFKKKKERSFELFKNFLGKVCHHKELTGLYKLDDLNVLVLNTNISDDKKVTCIDCKELKDILKSQAKEHISWFYSYGQNEKTVSANDKVNIIVAHQPLYDICEYIRLPYGTESQTTDFLSALQDFVNGNGIYLCGDKHTSSIAASYIHDIPHYFCGHPFTIDDNNHPSCCKLDNSSQMKSIEIDYNLIEVRANRTGQVRKIHLSKNDTESWKCQIRPIDTVVSRLYENSKNYIVRNSFAMLGTQSSTKYNSLANLSWRNLFNRFDASENSNNLKEISEFYSLFCRLKNNLGEAIEWNNSNIFFELCNIVASFFKENQNTYVQNIINIRGDYGSGKSTFLGLLYH